jgi:hypothetical protein
VTSARKAKANQQNARRSSGPTSTAGKARSASNARRHGLAVSISRDFRLAAAAEALTREIAGQDASEELLAVSRPIAEAQVDVMRIRQARHYLIKSGLDSLDLASVRRLELMDRYEGRAISRRNSAIRAYDAALALGVVNRLPSKAVA